MLLSTAYFPPVSYLSLLARDMTLSPDRVLPSHVFLEACENYQKQSYRNRCYILAGDGVQMLQVPVKHSLKGEVPLSSTSLRDTPGSPEISNFRGGSVRANVPESGTSPLNICSILVDYSTPWVVRTRRALDTAYETSAYYEYYRDEVFALLDARPRTLWELNLSTILFLLEKTGIACELSPTTEFAAPGEGPADDFRYTLHPKKADSILPDMGLDKPYYQVFRDRMGGFTPKMSCLDLLFNEGPDSILWLKAL